MPAAGAFDMPAEVVDRLVCGGARAARKSLTGAAGARGPSPHQARCGAWMTMPAVERAQGEEGLFGADRLFEVGSQAPMFLLGRCYGMQGVLGFLLECM